MPSSCTPAQHPGDLPIARGTSSTAEQVTLRERWLGRYKRAVDFDQWGQVIEAIEAYASLIATMNRDLSSIARVEDRTFIARLVLCLALRHDALQKLHVYPVSSEAHSNDSLTASPVFGLDKIRAIAEAFDLLFRGKPFPVDLAAYREFKSPYISREDIHAGALSATSGSTSSTQIPNNTPHHIRIRINRIGLKDTSVFIEPHLVVSVKNRAGRDLCAPMRSNTAADRTENHISCEFDVIVPLSLESISREDAAIFIEFVHYKPVKKKNSVKCFALLEPQEVKLGVMALELYKKPVEPERRKLALFTVKPLFMHVEVLELV